MILVHAKALAAEQVRQISTGEVFQKNSTFTKSQVDADDWEPVYVTPEPPTPAEDCGCGESVLDDDDDE